MLMVLMCSLVLAPALVTVFTLATAAIYSPDEPDGVSFYPCAGEMSLRKCLTAIVGLVCSVQEYLSGVHCTGATSVECSTPEYLSSVFCAGEPR